MMISPPVSASDAPVPLHGMRSKPPDFSMTPFLHGVCMDRVLRYVARLLADPPDVESWEVCRTMALLCSTTDRDRYLTNLRTAPAGSRAREIGSDIEAIMAGRTTREDLCFSTGPQIDGGGVPYCLKRLGHNGLHESHPDSGFDEEWGPPLDRASAEVRASAWLPDELLAVIA